MRRVLTVITVATSLLAGAALAAPGYYWEIGMEMEGMPFAMPKQKVCTPKDSKEPPVSGENDDCRILEKKQSGNRFRWKAECKDGTMTGDITSTPTSYTGSMQMSTRSGENMSMKMSGKRLGPCDYKDRSGEFVALQKQSVAGMAKLCQGALEEMQGQMLADQCPKERTIFCQRFASPEGYDKATRHLTPDLLEDEKLGAPVLARMCKLNHDNLLPKLCGNAVTGRNFGFVARHCPEVQEKLCAPAVEAGKFNYVGAHCPSERDALIKQHCEGRKYSSDIEPRFADFCNQAANNGEWLADGHHGSDSSAAASTSTSESSRASSNNSSNDASNDSSGVSSNSSARDPVADSVQKGLKQLKGLFGF